MLDQNGLPAPAAPPGRARRILVAGVGNMFDRDDGFGPEVARQLAQQSMPDGVQVTDYGIRGMHLAYDLLDEWDRLILIDLLPPRGAPGSVHIVQLDPREITAQAPDPHSMAPHTVLSAIGSMGAHLPPTTLVGCEPGDVGEGIGLTAPVAAAVRPAVATVLRLLAKDNMSTTHEGR